MLDVKFVGPNWPTGIKDKKGLTDVHFAPAGSIHVKVHSDDASLPQRTSPAQATGAAPCSPVKHLAWDDAAAGFCKPTRVVAMFDDAGGKGWGVGGLGWQF